MQQEAPGPAERLDNGQRLSDSSKSIYVKRSTGVCVVMDTGWMRKQCGRC